MARGATINELFDLSGRAALVTGGAGHLGTAISWALAEAGALAVVASRDLGACRRLAGEIRAAGLSALAVRMDVTSDASVRHALAEIRRRAGRLDVVVNNAFAGVFRPLGKISPADYSATLQGSLTSAYRVTTAALPLLRKSPAPSVVNVSTMYALVAPDPELYRGTPFLSPPGYGEAKAGMLQMTRYLASFLAAGGIRVNAVSPGPFPHGKSARSPAFMKRLAARCALGRTGRPEEIKGAVLYLASDASSFVTGQNLVVDGGWTIR
jgi:NAD(P)-dependent dehydrogenase (short-subunit alcohol dehydrogenase family)